MVGKLLTGIVLAGLLCMEISTVSGQATHDELSSEHQDLTVAMAVVEDSVEDLEEEVEDVADDIEENMEDEFEEFEEAIEEHLEAAGNEVASLRQEVQSLKKQLETSGLTELGEKVDRNREELLSLQEKVKSFKAELQTDMNSTLHVLQEVREHLTGLRQEFHDFEVGVALQYLPSSCTEIAEFHTESPSGHYEIRGPTGASVQVYCDMDRQSCSCGGTGAWMRVADLDMTDLAELCPAGFRLTVSNSKRMCTRITAPGCTSIIYPVHSVQYSKVCGRVRGYQQYTTDAFHHRISVTIDGNYADGVSITHGRSPRKHIWTFTAPPDENHFRCPCVYPSSPYTGRLPLFIENDYFCETGIPDVFSSTAGNRIYTEDPLWDGQGCSATSACCQFNSPPWFCKDLPQLTTDDIEVRVCTDQSRGDEDLHIELIELYIQ